MKEKILAVFTVGYLTENEVVAAFVDGVGVAFGCEWPKAAIAIDGHEGHRQGPLHGWDYTKSMPTVIVKRGPHTALTTETPLWCRHLLVRKSASRASVSRHRDDATHNRE